MADTQITSSNASAPTCMESVNRIVKLPVVESSLQTASNIYEKVKEYNSVTQWTCSTAENCVHKCVEVGKPIVQGLEGPIKKVDGVFCTGLDYVETKVPAVKLPPGEIIYQMYTTTKDYVNNTVTPAVGAAYAYVEPSVKTAYEKIEPVVESAKAAVEPAVEKAKTYVEPAVEKARTYVEPAVEKARSFVEPAIESFKHYASQENSETKQCTRGHPEGDVECEECQAAARKMEEEH